MKKIIIRIQSNQKGWTYFNQSDHSQWKFLWIYYCDTSISLQKVKKNPLKTLFHAIYGKHLLNTCSNYI